MPISRAQQEAVRRYNDTNYESVRLRVPVGRKQLIENLADANNMSINAIMNCLAAQACGLSYEVWNDPDYQFDNPNNPKISFTVKMEHRSAAYIKMIAQEQGCSASDIVNRALAEHLGFDLDMWTGDKQRRDAAQADHENQG